MKLFRLSLVWLSLLALGACAAPRATLVYSLQNLDCSSCLKAVSSKLGEQEGVVTSKVDKQSVEVRITYDEERATPEALDAIVAAEGFTWKREAGVGFWAPEIPFDAHMDVQKISTAGEEVDIVAHLAPNKVTIVDFFAPWCGPCRVVTHEIKSIMGERCDVALRTIDIVDWDRPVVAQHLSGVSNIPHILIYGKDGAQVIALTGVKKAELHAAVLKAGGPAPAPEPSPDAADAPKTPTTEVSP